MMSDAAIEATESGEQKATSGQKDPVASIAAQITHLSTGDRAALRRLFLTQSSAADGVVVGLLHRAEVGWQKPETFARWRLLAHVAAVLSGTGARAPHSPGAGFGRVLHAAGYSENRLMRLTAARGPGLIDQVVRATRYIAQAGGAPVDLRTVRHLIGEDSAGAEEARLRIARDYYSAQYASDGGKT